jgi:hypothetical protein
MPDEQSTYIGKDCIYTQLDNGIHDFIFIRATRQAHDEWFAQTARIFEQAEPNKTLLFMIDLRDSGLPPLGYVVNNVRQIQAKYPQHPPTRSAFLYSPTALRPLVRLFITWLTTPGKDKVRFFAASEFEKATAWLLANR